MQLIPDFEPRTQDEEERTQEETESSEGRPKNVTSIPGNVITAIPVEKGKEQETWSSKEKKKKPKKFNHNSYSTKKSISQNILNGSLLVANASQLKLILSHSGPTASFYIAVFLVVCSILIQSGIGVVSIILARKDIDKKEDQKLANKLNTGITCATFLVVVLNLLISAFGLTAEGKLEDKPQSGTNSTQKN